MKKRMIWLVTLLGFVLSIHFGQAQNGPSSGLYQISCGNYVECCGIAGSIRYSLPYERQSFVKLDINSQSHLATMTFLGADTQTVFRVSACPPTGPISFSFSNGLVFSNRIVFQADPGPSQVYWGYTVSNSANSLRINGTLRTPTGLCADVPNQFTHTNVVADLLPAATIRLSEVQVCWNSSLNRNYQVQYRSALDTNEWTNLGAAVPGNGSTNCIADQVPPGQPRRLYRVLMLP